MSRRLLKKYLLEAIGQMERDKVKMEFFGDLSALSPELRQLCERTREISKGYDGCQVNICLNYGGRDEIVNAVNRAVADGHTAVSEELLSRYMYTYPSPDPDMIIRTGGDFRISNFLLWQNAYSELIFTDTLWPDFGEADVKKCIAEFNSRQRRFGGLATDEA